MGRKREKTVYAADFETTVFSGQEYTEVWSAAIVQLNTEDVKILHSIEDFIDYIKAQKKHMLIYFHNLKFDGNFIMYHFIYNMKLEQAVDQLSDNQFDVQFIDQKRMKNNTFRYTISNMGQWYSIIWKVNDHIIEFRDSMKLLPFSLAAIGKSFGTRHKKLTMKYEGVRYAGCPITPEEQAYIENDVLVLKEALEIMYKQGHSSLTIGACCLDEFKSICGRDYQHMFPDLYSFHIDNALFDQNTAGDYIRRAYRGGWCYLKPEKAGKIYKQGLTADVNSLYPSMMHSDSGNIYPTGFPNFWIGDIPDQAKEPGKYYYVRLRTRFKLKRGKLPTIQIKGSMLYKGTEYLTTSDIYYKGKYYQFYRDTYGNVKPAKPTLTLTCTDYKLMLEHYDLSETEILDGCWFYAQSGLFDQYIDKYAEIKKNSKGAMRTLAKLFLNNLYGKFAATPDSSFQYAYTRPDEKFFRMVEVPAYEKTPGYIAIGAAVTSYARNFTIRAAQQNYEHFIYADTDSIHCHCTPDQLQAVPVDPVKFQHWKIEAGWDTGYFLRAKTYIEHVITEDGEPVKPWYNMKCAGMPDRCKKLFLRAMENDDMINLEDDLMPEEIAFLKQGKKDLTDFTYGLKIPGKLLPKKIPKGVLLVNTVYEIRR